MPYESAYLYLYHIHKKQDHKKQDHKKQYHKKQDHKKPKNTMTKHKSGVKYSHDAGAVSHTNLESAINTPRTDRLSSCLKSTHKSSFLYMKLPRVMSFFSSKVSSRSTSPSSKRLQWAQYVTGIDSSGSIVSIEYRNSFD